LRNLGSCYIYTQPAKNRKIQFIMSAIVVKLRSFALAILTMAVCPAHGATVFTTFGAGQGFAGGAAYILAQTEMNAFRFVPAQDCTLTHVDFAAAGWVGVENLTFALTNDSGGLPGTLLESWTFQDVAAAPPFPALVPVLSADSILHPVLLQGSTYWISATTATGSTTGSGGLWFYNELGIFETRLRSQDGGSTWTSYEANTAAFDVLGSTAPEPSGFLLVAIGLLGCAKARGWRNSKQ
jgi:hypothetical protein